jgi:hypothetical protein
MLVREVYQVHKFTALENKATAFVFNPSAAVQLDL